MASPADAPAILRLFERAFGVWPRIPLDVSPLAHLEWKMQAPPGFEPRHTVGSIAGEIVAADLRWIANVQVGEQIRLSSGGAEIAVDPAYQGRGFSRAIRESEIRRAQPGDVSISTRNEGRSDVVDAADGDRRIVRLLPRRVLAWGLRASLGAHRRSGLFHLARTLPRLVLTRSGPQVGLEQVLVTAIEQFDSRFDSLWTAASSAVDLARVRDASYLNWRYADPRSGRTLIIEASVDGQLVGFAVFRPAPPSADLLDLLVHPRHRRVAASLLVEGAARLRQRGVTSIGALSVPGHPDEQAFADAGFLLAAPDVEVRVNPRPRVGATLDWLAEPDSRWHLTLGDFEYA